MLAAMGVSLVGLIGCEDSSRRPVAYHPPSNLSRPSVASARIDPLPLDPANRAKVRPLNGGPVDRAALLAKQVEAAFAAGEQEFKAHHLDAARKDFDRALDMLLESGFDLDANPRLAALFHQVVETAHNDELLALQDGDGSGQQTSQPAPIDEIAAEGAAGAPAVPGLRTSAEGEIAAVQHDLPLTVNDIVLSYLNYFQTPRGRAIVETGLRRAGRYRTMIEGVLIQEGLPNDLIYLAQAESAFQPQALSRAGARGLWQFMSYRGKEYGLEHSWWVDDRQDPQKATQAAAHHLRDLYQMFGDWYLVMAAYNSGPGTVQHAIERTGYADFWQLYKLNALPQETRNYVPIILALTLIAKDPARYGVDVAPEAPLKTETVQPGHSIDLRLVSETIDVDLDTLRALNPQLLRLVTPAEPGFVLRVPEGTADRFRTEMAAIPPEKWASWRRHRVNEGETLSGVAQQYRVSSATLAEVNGLESGAPLAAGAKLIIPVAPESQTSLGKVIQYRARHNDTLASIANEFDVTVAELKKWNHLRSDKVTRNARLRIYPGALGPAPAANVRKDTRKAAASETASREPVRSAALASPASNGLAKRSADVTLVKPVSSTVAESPEPAVAHNEPSRARSGASSAASSAAVTHRVQQGETLYSIARAYQTTVDALRKGNKFLFSRSLEAGDTLTIFPQR